MKDNKQKLELTWIGKNNAEYNIANIEPRILQEAPELSNCKNDPNTQNKIIHGDNLLALKSLLPEYEGKVKCIYIDPPYNTGNAFEHYDDAVEHSTWLSLMKPRLELLRLLLSEDGVIFVQIDNKELHYLKVLCDEAFGRSNYRNSIIVRKGIKNVQKQFNTVERLNAGFDTILMYSKNSDLRIPNLFGRVDKKDIKGSWNNHWRGTDRPTMRYELLGITPEKGQFRWSKERSYRAVVNYNIFLNYLNKINLENQKAFDSAYQNYLEQNSIEDVKNFELIRLSKTGKPEHYIPPTDKILLSENWMDLIVAGRLTDFEHEKNEFLLHRILDWLTKPNDLILDSFLGSGTTAAVAHKMNRRYIGIEMGDHSYTHCKTRLDKVIAGEQGGISRAVGWQGGGAYKFYELAPSFITKDEFGNLVIDAFYNDSKLIQAMCKLMNFIYQPSQEEYWKHGIGQGQNYLFVTTQILTSAIVAQIAKHLSGNETLVICAKSFESGANKIDSRITIKKIPQSVLKACQFGKKEYLLPIKEISAQEIEDLENEDNDD
jgi:adenine-specific DNA-methyltransferase